MKGFIISLVFLVAAVNAKSRSKRQAFNLPDGVELLVGSVRTSFACPQNAVGYYADVENNCQIFHVCNTVEHPDGTVETLQYSFMCGNQTVFNQLTFTCAMPEDAVTCSEASRLFYLNDNLRSGDPKVQFLSEADISQAAPFILGLANRAYDAAGGRGGPGRG